MLYYEGPGTKIMNDLDLLYSTNLHELIKTTVYTIFRPKSSKFP